MVLSRVEVTEHESPGNGVSYRFAGDRIVGSALAVDGATLHAVAFATKAGADGSDTQDGGAGRYPGFFERRSGFPW